MDRARRRLLARRAWDLNPRGRGRRPGGFQDRCTSPLCEPSMSDPASRIRQGVIMPNAILLVHSPLGLADFPVSCAANLTQP
jgi:hypothetical protein